MQPVARAVQERARLDASALYCQPRGGLGVRATRGDAKFPVAEF